MVMVDLFRDPKKEPTPIYNEVKEKVRRTPIYDATVKGKPLKEGKSLRSKGEKQ
jgi:hypothetical protein